MDYSKVDKDGNKLTSIVEPANQNYQAGYHAHWLKDPEYYEPTAEDIKCELQLQALSAVEPLKWEIDLGWFKKLLALPLKSLESMIATVGITAFLIAAFTPTWLILNGAEVDMGYFGYHRIAWFLYSFIMLCSLSTFMCFSQSVYPSEYQWDKKTYN